MFSKLDPVKFIRAVVTNDLLLPLILLLSYLAFLFIARGVFPTSEQLIISFENLYAKYGYEIIFMAALFESLIFLNLFAPGGGALILGVIFARSGQTELDLVIIFASLGAVLGYTLDFVIGYLGLFDIINTLGYGKMIDRSKGRIERFGNQGLIFGFIHPNLGAFVSLAAGVLKIKPANFFIIAALSTIVWATLWGLAVYAMGDVFLVILRKYSFLVVLLIIGIMMLGRIWGKEEKNLKS
ncbi:VTT domain-containing protein [Candidatus Daviesbacteria bacterium]|nr:VTT domain-containing protein [Candidatus Daviesbacteria bacterium]